MGPAGPARGPAQEVNFLGAFFWGRLVGNVPKTTKMCLDLIPLSPGFRGLIGRDLQKVAKHDLGGVRLYYPFAKNGGASQWANSSNLAVNADQTRNESTTAPP